MLLTLLSERPLIDANRTDITDLEYPDNSCNEQFFLCLTIKSGQIEDEYDAER